MPGIFAIGDVAAFPLKIYDRIARVERVDHACRSAHHCVKALLSAQTHTYDYLPYFYSRVFEYEGSPTKGWWQFFGDNAGETIEIGNFDPKIATFWIDSGKLKGVLVESGSPEEFQRLPKLARSQPSIDKAKLQQASSVEEALEIAQASILFSIPSSIISTPWVYFLSPNLGCSPLYFISVRIGPRCRPTPHVKLLFVLGSPHQPARL